MSFAKEDWERVHLTDQMYLKEKEWEEQEHFQTEEKPPAKITLNTESMDLLTEIENKIKEKYKGKLNCVEQRADLYVYLDGKETPVDEITDTHIHYDNGVSVLLQDTDIATLAYINQVI